jgi:undecaprenyl-diphosphatase
VALAVAILLGGALCLAVEVWGDQPIVKQAVVRLLTRNFGQVTDGVYRSDQIHRPWLRWVWRTQRFRTVINLAWSGTAADLAEERLLASQGVVYRKFSWTPVGPPSPEELRDAVAALDGAPRPLLIHCRAGRDRTGGLVGIWRLDHGASLEEVKRDWTVFGTPSAGWQRAVEEASRKEPSGAQKIGSP